MPHITLSWRHGALALALAAALSGCGGGDAPGAEGASRFASQIAEADNAAASPRRRALADAPVVDANAVLDWAEYKYSALFAKGPASFALEFEGNTYTVRAYPHAGGTRYLGITAQGEVYGLGDFTGGGLQRFGAIADFEAQVNADRCNVHAGTCASPVAALPAALLDKAAHADCPALRSGPYRLINPTDGDPDWNTSVAQVDAAAGRITFADGTFDTATATGRCSFSAQGGRMRLVVSPAGIMVFTSFNDNLGKQVLAVGFPEQPAVLADMAGTVQWSEFHVFDGSGTGGKWLADHSLSDFDAAGRHLSHSTCANGGGCTAFDGPLGTLRVSAKGGFDYVVPGAATPPRFFSYKPGSGDVVWFAVTPSSLVVGTRPLSRALPSLGEVQRRWDVQMNWQATANASFSDLERTVTAVDPAARTYTFTNAGSGRVDVWSMDTPRIGLRHRPASANASEVIAMALPGTGMVVYSNVTTDATRSSGIFGITVDKP